MFRRCRVIRLTGRIAAAVFFLGLITLSVFAELYNRAPDVMPGTLPEMKTTEYWIARMKNPDEIILSQDAIERMNTAYEQKVRSSDPFGGVAENRKPDLSYWWPGHVLAMPDFHTMSPAAIADTVRNRIKIQIDYMRSKDFGNALAIKYSGRELDNFEEEMVLDTVGNEVTIRDGISVRTTQLRNIPMLFPHQYGLSENAKTRWDIWNIGIVRVCSPLTVFMPSRSGEYVLVACDEGYGWIRTGDIAFGSKRQLETFTQPKDFMVCTGDHVQFYSDAECRYAAGWFRMGDRLPAASNNRVTVPVRNSDGSLDSETAYLRNGADVNHGWLPYTRRNVVETAFKLLDNTYDWTGAWFGRQHETTYRDIFAVFGFRLPWHGALFTIFGNNEMVITPEMGKDGQYNNILKNEPFITLQSCGGHAQLFLGDLNGVPIVFDQHGYGYEESTGTYVEVRRCNIGTVAMPTYFLKRNVTFCTLK